MSSNISKDNFFKKDMTKPEHKSGSQYRLQDDTAMAAQRSKSAKLKEARLAQEALQPSGKK